MSKQGFHRAKKSLGQNFLVDEGTIQKIVQCIDAQEGQNIIEIGPGQGSITEGLIRNNCNLHCIEYDSFLYNELKIKYADNSNFSISEADILKYDWDPILPVDQVVGNLPYNISSQILIKLFESHKKIDRAVVMLQKEAGERLTAGPGSKTYGILSVYAAFFSEAHIEFHIPPTVFRPQPKVDSVLVSLQFKNETDARVDNIDLFRQLIRKAFNQRRKTLKNSLKIWYLPEFQEKFPWHLRPEALSVDDFILLYLLLKENSEFRL